VAPRPPFSAGDLAATTDTGRLEVCGLKRLWSRWDAIQRGGSSGPNLENRYDHLVLDAIGIGLEQGYQFLRGFPSFPELEDWVETTTGGGWIPTASLGSTPS
jgi:hypothetical protein